MEPAVKKEADSVLFIVIGKIIPAFILVLQVAALIVFGVFIVIILAAMDKGSK